MTKIRSRYKTYPKEEIKAAFDSAMPWEHSAWHPTKMMLQERLDTIWRLGDRDEVSIKHVLYSIGAILAGRKWNEQLDYGFEMNEKAKVVRSWEIVETMLDYWGLNTFAKVFYSTKFGQTGYGTPLPAYYSYDRGSAEPGDDTPAARAYRQEQANDVNAE